MTVTTLPAANTWDIPTIVDAAMVALRVENDDLDAVAVQRAAQEATALIDVEMDMVPVPVTTPPTLPFDAGAVPALVQAAVQLTTILYLSPPREDDDPVAAVRAQVRPWKARWSIA